MDRKRGQHRHQEGVHRYDVIDREGKVRGPEAAPPRTSPRRNPTREGAVQPVIQDRLHLHASHRQAGTDDQRQQRDEQADSHKSCSSARRAAAAPRPPGRGCSAAVPTPSRCRGRGRQPPQAPAGSVGAAAPLRHRSHAPAPPRRRYCSLSDTQYALLSTAPCRRRTSQSISASTIFEEQQLRCYPKLATAFPRSATLCSQRRAYRRSISPRPLPYLGRRFWPLRTARQLNLQTAANRPPTGRSPAT